MVGTAVQWLKKALVPAVNVMFICPSVDRFCHCDSITTMQDAVLKLYRCVVEVKKKTKKTSRLSLKMGVVRVRVLDLQR